MGISYILSCDLDPYHVPYFVFALIKRLPCFPWASSFLPPSHPILSVLFVVFWREAFIRTHFRVAEDTSWRLTGAAYKVHYIQISMESHFLTSIHTKALWHTLDLSVTIISSSRLNLTEVRSAPLRHHDFTAKSIRANQQSINWDFFLLNNLRCTAHDCTSPGWPNDDTSCRREEEDGLHRRRPQSDK